MKIPKPMPLLCALSLAFSFARGQDIVTAVANGDLAKVKELIEATPSLIKAKTPRAWTLLHLAARLGNGEIAKYLIAKGADLNARRDNSFTPLFDADIQVTRVLVESGADIDAVTPDGWSAISWALESEDRQVFGYLFERKAKLVLPDPGTFKGIRSVELIMGLGSVELFDLYARKGLSPGFENNAKMTLAHFAAESPSTALFQRLLESGAPIDRPDIFGWTPLHKAAFQGNRPIVEWLVQNGADKSARTLDGKTPHGLALEGRKMDVANVLKAMGADTSEARPPRLTSEYFGIGLPGLKPEPFIPGFPDIQKGFHGTFSFSPDGKEAYWKPVWDPASALFESKRIEGIWTKPKISGFSAENQGDDAPFLSPDGKRLYFLSQRPVVDGKMPFPYVEKIWVMERTPAGWSEPKKLPEAVNAVNGIHWQISVDAQSNLYFGATEGIYCARFVAEAYAKAERLGPAVNDGKEGSFSPFISADGSYLAFSRTSPISTYQMFLSFRKQDGTWTEAVNLSEYLKHESFSLNPRVSPDGKYFFFTGRHGLTYWMDASFIETLRPKETAAR